MENKALIEYRGSIRYETIGELIHRFKVLIPRLGIQIGTYKRILLILIESLENIMKHSEEPAADENHSFLAIFQHDNRFVIHTENSLRNESVNTLKNRLDFLNSLDTQGLKNVYKETITNGVFTNTGGAGLGLIEIVKISGNPVQYQFHSLNEMYTVYNQDVVIEVR